MGRRMLVVIGSDAAEADRIFQAALAVDIGPELVIHAVMLVREMPGDDAAALAITGMGDVVQRWLVHQTAQQQAAIAKARARFEAACATRGIRHRWLPVSRDLPDTGALWYDLVIAGRHLQPATDRDEQIAAAAIRPRACPLISLSESGPIQPTKVLAALSGSPASTRALKAYVSRQPWSGSELSLLHVAGDAEARLSEDLLARAADYCRDHGVAVARSAVVAGESAATIARIANDWSADVIVMGDSGGGFLSFHELGRTLRTVMGSAPQTIFVAA